MSAGRDHGGGLDGAALLYGGVRDDWLDLSTGINPCPYPLPRLPAGVWTALPDSGAAATLEAAARRVWRVPGGADILAAPGASALIARLPGVLTGVLTARSTRAGQRVAIPGPTYNEHAAAFAAAGWQMCEEGSAPAQVLVHPNNPDGRLWATEDLARAAVSIVDESFCDICPEQSLIAKAARPGMIILKSFGKFWGLAGLRLGFAMGDPVLVASLRTSLGPWPVSGPALEIGRAALDDPVWADAARARLTGDAVRLDALMRAAGAGLVGGTPLFRLYDCDDAVAWQVRLARSRIWTRVFPYSARWLRLGLPGTAADWARLEAAL